MTQMKGGAMINEISRILVKFRPCFSRKAAFSWFVVVIVGFIVRLDIMVSAHLCDGST